MYIIYIVVSQYMLQPLFMYIPFATYLSLYMVFVPYGSANEKRIYIYTYTYILVGGFNPCLKKKKKPVGMSIPNIWKIIKFMFQTTNQIYCS